ncbi:hypothetical protein BVX97_03920 [bacterium E08(2017)]|nr:hypothetical protein BVX97_03920 [bacterium E08(2017)]
MTSENKGIVSMVKCSSYGSNLEQAVFNLLDHIDKSNTLITSGKKVLIKPNLLTDRDPSKAVTTHPEVVRCIIRYLKKQNAEICVADSPASAVKVQRVWQQTGFTALCEEENVPLVNLEESGSKNINSNGFSFNIATPIIDADLVINVPKVKTHTLTLLTAGVKNYYGTLPGYQKAHMHKNHSSPSDFGKFLREIYSHIPPNINLADAVVGMEGNGPSGGNPVELGFLAASTNAIALDMALCRILKINPAHVPYLNCSSGTLDNIEIRGADPSDISPASFRLPNTLPARLFPTWLMKALDPFLWFRPSIKDSCIACGRCIKACPAEALDIDTSIKKAVLSPDNCIGCCCCHEICPEQAIDMVQSPLIKFLTKGKDI